MGNASSKAVRRLSKETTSRHATAGHARPEKPLAFERRDPTIDRDAKDPHLLQNLGRLGQVRVAHPTQQPMHAGDARDMYRARALAEAEATGGAANRLRATSLAELLDARKTGTSAGELVGRYGVDVGTLRVLRVVNTPSVDAREVVRTTDEYGEEHVTMVARWVDPAPADNALRR